MAKIITFDNLRNVLADLGYELRRAGDGAVVFRNPSRHLLIVLPDMPERDAVRPVDLLSVRKTLANDGVIEEEEFDTLFRINKGDRLVWTDPATGTAIRVTAAAGESDGMVVIKQMGAFMACPVDQLRKDTDATAGADGRH